MACFGLFNAGWHKGKAVGEQEANSDTYAREANQQIEERCSDLPPLDMAGCIRQVVEATNEHERAERDLVAQTDMALWALGMLVISALGTGLAAFGTILIWRTFDQTREAVGAALEANRIAEAAYAVDQRPWLSIGTPNLKRIFVMMTGTLSEGRRLWIDYELNLSNSGKTPALEISYLSQIDLDPPVVDQSYNRLWADLLRDVTSFSGGAEALAPGESIVLRFSQTVGLKPETDATKATNALIRLMVAVAYSDVMGGERKVTRAWFFISDTLGSKSATIHSFTIPPANAPMDSIDERSLDLSNIEVRRFIVTMT